MPSPCSCHNITYIIRYVVVPLLFPHLLQAMLSKKRALLCLSVCDVVSPDVLTDCSCSCPCMQKTHCTCGSERCLRRFLKNTTTLLNVCVSPPLPLRAGPSVSVWCQCVIVTDRQWEPAPCTGHKTAPTQNSIQNWEKLKCIRDKGLNFIQYS